MKKYKNVKAIKARVCCGYVRNFNGDYAPYCIGVRDRLKIHIVTVTNASVPNTSITEKRAN